MSNQHLIITLLCDDRVGIVQEIADTITKANGNWLDSRMLQLEGKFTGMLSISIAEEKVNKLKEALEELSNTGIEVLIENANDYEPIVSGKVLSFELIGADRLGIMSEISGAFLERGISIDNLETHCSSMPWSGSPLFEATGILMAPENINTEELLDQLNEIEDHLGIDISVTEQL